MIIPNFRNNKNISGAYGYQIPKAYKDYPFPSSYQPFNIFPFRVSENVTHDKDTCGTKWTYFQNMPNNYQLQLFGKILTSQYGSDSKKITGFITQIVQLKEWSGYSSISYVFQKNSFPRIVAKAADGDKKYMNIIKIIAIIRVCHVKLFPCPWICLHPSNRIDNRICKLS